MRNTCSRIILSEAIKAGSSYGFGVGEPLARTYEEKAK